MFEDLSGILGVLWAVELIFRLFLLVNVDFKCVFILLFAIFVGLLEVLDSFRILYDETGLFVKILDVSAHNLFLE
jgi:hypothetical protein